MNFRIDGERLYIGPGELDWVGFYAPIISAEQIDILPDIKIKTELGEYILRDADRPNTMRVLDISGKKIRELQDQKFWEKPNFEDMTQNQIALWLVAHNIDPYPDHIKTQIKTMDQFIEYAYEQYNQAMELRSAKL